MSFYHGNSSDSSRPQPQKALDESPLNLPQAKETVVETNFSHPQAKKTVDESRLQISQPKKTVVEPNSSKPSKTPFVRKDPLEGKAIGDNNRYLLQTLLGQGGMSKVYQAFDTKFEDRIVAIKLMTNYSAVSGQHLIKRFMGEVQAISRLKHPNIIQILDFGITPDEAPFDGSPFYVMEYFDGKTLQNLLTEHKTLPLASVLNIIHQVCAGLKQAHQKGIVHRDLKPDNIFLVAGGAFGEIVKIIDFGIAKNLSSDDQNHTKLTQAGSFIGTYHYASPEQCRGLPNIDQRSDIYSLGVILYEAICGHNPYGLDDDLSPSQADWIACHIRVPPKPLKEQAGSEKIEDELANVVMKCLAKSPQDRFSDLGELQNAVANIRSVRMGVNYHAQRDPKISNDLEGNDPKKPTLQEVPDEEKKVSLVSPTGSLEPSEDLELNHASIFGLLNKYRLLMGAKIASVPLNKSQLLMGGGIACVLVSIFAGSTYLQTQRDLEQSYLQTQRDLEQSYLRDLEHIEELKADEKYQKCAQHARTISQEYSNLLAEAKKAENLLRECLKSQDERQLAEARKLAEQSRFKDAISLAAKVSVDTDVYPEAQELMSKWAEQIFKIASNKYKEGNLQEAIRIVGAIPAENPIANKAQTAIQQWNEDWQQNQNHLQVAQEALDERRWQDAINEANFVSDTAYWQKQSEPIIRKAKAEIRKSYVPRKPVPRKPVPRKPTPQTSSPKIPNSGPIPSNTPFPPKDGSSRIEWLCQINPHHLDCSK